MQHVGGLYDHVGGPYGPSWSNGFYFLINSLGSISYWVIFKFQSSHGALPSVGLSRCLPHGAFYTLYVKSNGRSSPRNFSNLALGACLRPYKERRNRVTSDLEFDVHHGGRHM